MTVFELAGELLSVHHFTAMVGLIQGPVGGTLGFGLGVGEMEDFLESHLRIIMGLLGGEEHLLDRAEQERPDHEHY